MAFRNCFCSESGRRNRLNTANLVYLRNTYYFCCRKYCVIYIAHFIRRSDNNYFFNTGNNSRDTQHQQH